MATPKQVSFIGKLLSERQHPADWAALDLDALSVGEASDIIGKLLKAPFLVTEKAVDGLDLSNVPHGHYAAQDDSGTIRFFHISNTNRPEYRGNYKGWIFVSVQAGDDFHKQGAQRPGQSYSGKSVAALRNIAADPFTASKLYGQTIGRCGVCGHTLTDPISIERGIGPICEGRFQ